MTSLPSMPFEYSDDPEPLDREQVPRANELGYVEVADCTVLVDGRGGRITFMEEQWAGDDGIAHAWLATDESNVVHVRDYA